MVRWDFGITEAVSMPLPELWKRGFKSRPLSNLAHHLELLVLHNVLDIDTLLSI
jgi:hypothetical protein